MRMVSELASSLLLTVALLPTACVPEVPAPAAGGIEAGHATAKVAALPIDQRAVQLLQSAIAGHRLVLIGEIHGTRETPALLGELAARQAQAGKPVVLALEIDSREQPRVDAYLASSGDAAAHAALLAGTHWRDPMHDGRDSAAMAALIERIRQLRNAGADIRIDLFDAPGRGERNRRMADHLRATAAAAPQALLLVLTGNVHAMTHRPPWKMIADGKPIEPPMTAGRYLADFEPYSIDIKAADGSAWNCMNRECRAHPVSAWPTTLAHATLQSMSDGESAWDAELALPRFTASPPAIAGSRR